MTWKWKAAQFLTRFEIDLVSRTSSPFSCQFAICLIELAKLLFEKKIRIFHFRTTPQVWIPGEWARTPFECNKRHCYERIVQCTSHKVGYHDIMSMNPARLVKLNIIRRDGGESLWKRQPCDERLSIWLITAQWIHSPVGKPWNRVTLHTHHMWKCCYLTKFWMIRTGKSEHETHTRKMNIH